MSYREDTVTYHCLSVVASSTSSFKRSKTALSIGRRTELSDNAPFTFFWLPAIRRKAMQVYFASVRSDCDSGSGQRLQFPTGVDLCTHTTKLTQPNLQQKIDVFRHNLRFGRGEHSKNDDGASPLYSRDVLVST